MPWSAATLLTAGALLILAPVVWAVLSLLKTPDGARPAPPTLLPSTITLDNYTEALDRFDFPLYFRNTVVVTVAATVLTLVINSMAAFALGQVQLPRPQHVVPASRWRRS